MYCVNKEKENKISAPIQHILSIRHPVNSIHSILILDIFFYLQQGDVLNGNFARLLSAKGCSLSFNFNRKPYRQAIWRKLETTFLLRCHLNSNFVDLIFLF